MITEDERRQIEAILHDYQRGRLYTQAATDKIVAILRPSTALHCDPYKVAYFTTFGRQP